MCSSISSMIQTNFCVCFTCKPAFLTSLTFQYHTLRKKAAERDRQNQVDSQSDSRNKSEPEMIIPSMMRIEPRTYMPGRVTPLSLYRESIKKYTSLEKCSKINHRLLINLWKSESSFFSFFFSRLLKNINIDEF